MAASAWEKRVLAAARKYRAAAVLPEYPTPVMFNRRAAAMRALIAAAERPEKEAKRGLSAHR